jgi:hypothetical protein
MAMGTAMIATIDTVRRMTVRFGMVKKRGLARVNATKIITNATNSPLCWIQARVPAVARLDVILPATADVDVNFRPFPFS